MHNILTSIKDWYSNTDKAIFWVTFTLFGILSIIVVFSYLHILKTRELEGFVGDNIPVPSDVCYENSIPKILNKQFDNSSYTINYISNQGEFVYKKYKALAFSNIYKIDEIRITLGGECHK